MTDTTKNATDPAAKPKKKKRRLLKIIATLMILFIVFVALLPTIVSTGFGTGIVLSFVNGSMPGEVEIDDLNVGWFSSTSVNGLRLKDPDGNVVIAATAEAPDVTLLSLIQGNKTLGNVTLTADEVNIEQYEDGSLNLERALGPSKEKDDKEETTYPEGLAVKLVLKAPKATFKPYNQEPAVLSDGELQVDLAGGQQIAYSVTGWIQQGEFKGRIQSAADVKDLFDAQGKLQIAKLKIEAPKNSAEVPTRLIDSVAKTGGKLAAIAGPTVTLTYSASGSLADLKANVNVKGERLTLNADANARFNDDLQFIGGSLKDGKLLHVKQDEETFIQLAKGPDGKPTTNVRIIPANDFVLHNSRVDIKPGEGGIDLSKSTATFTTEPMKFTIDDPKLGKRTLTLDAITLNYDGPKGLTNGKLVAQTGQGNETGTLALDFTGNNLFKTDGSIDYDKLTVALDAQIKEFALSLIDELLMTDGMLNKAIGSKLNATAKAEFKPTEGGNAGTYSIVAKADQLDANLSGPITATRKQTDKGVVFENVVMKLGEPGRVSARLSQPLLNMLKDKVPALANTLNKTTLANQSVTLTVNELTAPLDGTLLAKANADVAVQVDPFSYDLSTGDTADPNKQVTLQNLTAKVKFAGQSQPVTVGISGLAKHGEQTADLKADANVSDLFDAEGQLDTDTLTAKINAELTNLPTALADALIDKQNIAHHALGASINVTLNADAKLAKSGETTTYDGSGKVTIKSANADVKLTGKLVGSRLQLNTAPEASYANVTLTKALADAFQKMGTDPASTTASTDAPKWSIAKDTPISVTFSKADLPLDGDLSSAVLAFNASMPELALVGDPRFEGASVRDFKLTLNGDTVGKQLNFTANSKLIHLDQEGSLTVTAVVTQPLDDARGIDANVQVKNAPTALADAFANMDGLIGALEGKTIGSVALIFKRTGNAPDTFGVDIQSTTLKGGVAGTYTPGKRIELSPNQRIAASLKPAAMAIIQKRFGEQLPAALRDMKSIDATVEIPTLSLALAEVKVPAKQADVRSTTTATVTTAASAADTKPGPGGNQASKASAAEETATKIVAADSRMVININANGPYIQKENANRAVNFENVIVKLDAGQSLDNAKVSVNATPVSIPVVNGKPIDATSPNADQIKRGELTVNADVKGLADKSGHFKPSVSTIIAKIQATNVSAAALDDALDQGGVIIALFKDTANLTSNVSMAPGKPGTFDLNLTSGNMLASGKGIIENDVVTFTEDFTTTAMLTKDMPDAVRNFLVIIKVVSDEKPLSLTIPAKGFKMPLNFGEGDLIDISKVEADIAFDLGTVKAEGDGIAATVVGIISKATGAQKQIGRITTAAFSPGNVVLKNGIVTYKEPMKMDYGGVSFSYNGSINLNTKSLDQLSITVPFASIKVKEIQSLAGGVPIPIGGNLDAPKLDGGKLTKEMVNVALKAGFNRGLGELIPGGNKGGLPGLDGLFPPKDKPKPEENKPDPNNPDDGKSSTNDDAGKKPTVEDAAVDLLRGVLGGNKPAKKPDAKPDAKKEEEKKDDKKSSAGDDGKDLLEGLIGGGKKDEKKE